ncbi:DUF4871 domain-containing protein [Viridibacillus sp. YIM B01967]|uniref:DUF4871 domain-containing protein n=1 Tax=Viridibacillus soli TaxID=2798301 RepID=A0ABS1H6G2_9BACL|nr:DUF4871 domain-containing protein [Viridibacillus soli]MBK3495004.1 DUF4871 domain-containing protein [Viridibacillus soli]
MIKKAWILMILLLVPVSACTDKDEKLHDWKESEIFKAGDYEMIGIEERVGFIYDKDTPIVEGQVGKFMWDFWGEKDQLKGRFKVLGTHEGSEEEIIIIPESVRELKIPPNKHNTADISIPTNMEFEKSGMWKLDVYLDDKLFDTIYVNVNKK